MYPSRPAPAPPGVHSQSASAPEARVTAPRKLSTSAFNRAGAVPPVESWHLRPDGASHISRDGSRTPTSSRTGFSMGSHMASYAGSTNNHTSSLGSANRSPHPAYSRSYESSSGRTTATLPAEMTLFDSRPKQTLLADMEYILGHKITFPFIESLRQSIKRRTVDQGHKGKKLVKERRVEDGWEVWQGVEVVVVEKQGEAPVPLNKGRGVRECNWV
ncbi:hypothetical protein IAU60_002055 [Kwoniella sp. DSM 27419]